MNTNSYDSGRPAPVRVGSDMSDTSCVDWQARPPLDAASSGFFANLMQRGVPFDAPAEPDASGN